MKRMSIQSQARCTARNLPNVEAREAAFDKVSVIAVRRFGLPSDVSRVSVLWCYEVRSRIHVVISAKRAQLLFCYDNHCQYSIQIDRVEDSG